jgi:hypothetical protein
MDLFSCNIPGLRSKSSILPIYKSDATTNIMGSSAKKKKAKAADFKVCFYRPIELFRWLVIDAFFPLENQASGWQNHRAGQ